VFVSRSSAVPPAVEVLKAGAVDVLPKPLQAEDLLHAVHGAVQSHRDVLAERRAFLALRARFDALTPRERQVCLGVARGQTNKQIADDCVLSIATIKFHRARALGKLGLTCVPELVLLLKKLAVLESLPSPPRQVGSGVKPRRSSRGRPGPCT
jgi:FixJ family two-component response regulator